MPSTVFEENIALFDKGIADKQSDGGVILTSKLESSPDSLSPHEFFALEIAKKFNADAVYFRYFEDGRESIPQIYIYDNTDGHLTNKEAEIHTKVWSGCLVPMFIFINKDEIKIFDAREKVQIKGDLLYTSAIDTIKLAGNAISEFTTNDFATGLFWEDDKYEKNFQFGTSAYKDLIDGLKKVYNDFQGESGLSPHVSLKLLVQCLLVKYLEERDEESGYFAKSYFKNHFGCNNFCEVISSGQLLALLDKLSTHFNGKIFEWSLQDEKAERNAINKAKVKKLATYLDGNTKNDQYVIWRLYSFSHLPVELISSVYEELLGKGKKDTVYTPDMVASTLVDECMPLKNPKENFRLIDVSCGSGIFLVKAYKRIIQWWRYQKWKETGIMEKPDLVTMTQLLKGSIFGIDIQGDAVRLSVFSLALALLDDLDPKTIWTKLRFENLNSNITERDFFDFISDGSTKNFDLVIGNPPFNPPDGINNGNYYSHLQTKYNYQSEIDIPDHNLALLFLVEAMKLLKPEAILCLIQPSGPLLYQNDEAFKRAIFSKYNLLQVIDFTRLGDVLWGKANVATAAIFLQNSLPNDREVTHITVQRTSANVKKLFLELDRYDFHYIPKDLILTNSFSWKANLLGGGRMISLLERLSKLTTLGEVLTKRENEDGWKVGEGFIEKGKNPKPADFITGQKYLPSNAFTEKGIDWSKVYPCRIKSFKRPREKAIYSPPHLLIKENIGKKNLSIQLSDEYLVFRANVIGVHAPRQQREKLVELESYFKAHNDILRFYIYATSSQLSISKATVPLKEDFMKLPYPSRKSDLNISGAEKILINDILTYSLGPEKNEINRNCDQEALSVFSKTFCQALNSIYAISDKKFQLVKRIESRRYYALHLEYSKQQFEGSYEKDINLEGYIEKLIPQRQKNQKTHVQRILKYYSKDTIVLVKPKNLKYWLPSIALRDADETFADYVKSGF
ncbi:MAG: N-6 DNA methylase [Flammeovirgaceae bacterium]|jgi:hypothetical protein|nr:N-6 DNA methylase [Flammeovirgaceae bacterium]